MSFDMDFFVVVLFGKKIYWIKMICYNLDFVFNEKMIFQVLNYEQQYQFVFIVIDYDKYFGNDFIVFVNFLVQEIIFKVLKVDFVIGLYNLKEVVEFLVLVQRICFMRLGFFWINFIQSLFK